MNDGVLRSRATYPGEPRAAAEVRRALREQIGAGHPAADEIVLLTVEAYTNAITHTGSRDPGGSVTIALYAEDRAYRVEITDQGGAQTTPAVREDLYAEGGRGLFLLDALSKEWGMRREDGGGLTVWFRVSF
ncbi:ATP-binding protein [Actinomadura scrupuli]|uniref:ATP-binding protein n=1 Tax=Actinomadura scrupuli TaxID=559629 RepID=UPI003D97D7A6